MHRSGTGLFTDLGPARWVKIRTPDGGPHWVSQPASHVSSEQTKHSQEVTGAGAGHGHPEDKVEALPADLAIGDVFCIVLHALGNGDPIKRWESLRIFDALSKNDIRFQSVDVSSACEHQDSGEISSSAVQDHKKSENKMKEFRWRQIVERERNHQQIWRDLLHDDLFTSPESPEEMTLQLPQVWVVTENDMNGNPGGKLKLCICKSYAEFEKHLLQTDLAESLWGAFNSSFAHYRKTHNDDGSKKGAEFVEAQHSPPNDAALNTSFHHASASDDSRLARTNSFDSHSHHGRASELNRSPTYSSDELLNQDQHASSIKSIEKVIKRSNALLLNTWQPDGKDCHMQTMTFIDIEKKPDGRQRKGDVKVYWNRVSPPGHEFVDNIMLSPQYWNLPPPGLIISVTGSAKSFKEDNELCARDQQFILFKLELPKLPNEAHEELPARKLPVPVRIRIASDCDARTCDSLLDVLFRIADYLTQSPEDYHKFGGKSLVNLAQLVAKAQSREDLITDEKIEEILCEKEFLQFELKFQCEGVKGFDILPKQREMAKGTSAEQLSKQRKYLSDLSDNFEKFMNDVSRLPLRKDPLCKEVSMMFPFCVEVITKNIENDSATELQYKTVSITNFIEDSEIFDSWGSTNEPDRQSTNEPDRSFSVNVFACDDWDAFQRRIHNFSMICFDGCFSKARKNPWVFPTDDKNIEKQILKFLTLPQPIWRDSTLLLHQETEPKAELSHNSKLQLFSKSDFEKFKSGKQSTKKCVLLRTQGDGCNLNDDVIKRILHHVAFLLPQQFGSLWIITGGTNKGIMKLCGSVIASLSGESLMKMSQISLIGVASTGPIIKESDNKISIKDFQENYRISKSGKFESLRKTLQCPSERRCPSERSTFADINHSHLCLIGDETSYFGSEVPLRSEIERYAAEKFGVPMLQFVFGGGPITVATTLAFQSSPNALSCIVKGSGRFCHAIERCAEDLGSKLEDALDKQRVGWLLKTSMEKTELSNHEFSQIRSITENKDKFVIFDHLTTNISSILKKFMKQKEVIGAFINPSIPATIEQHQLFCRKGGRVLTVRRKAASGKSEDELEARILCTPPYMPRLGPLLSGVKKTQKYDISLLYELILSYKDGQTLPPKLVVTTNGANGTDDHIEFQQKLQNTLLHSEQMDPNYVVVKFFDIDGFETLVNSEIGESKSKGEEKNPDATKQGQKQGFPDDNQKDKKKQELLEEQKLLDDIKHQLILFRNNPYAAGEQVVFELPKVRPDPDAKSERTTCFHGFHVGIVSSNRGSRKRSDKFISLLSHIRQSVECAWIHFVHRGNFTSDLSDVVVNLCSGASLVVFKNEGNNHCLADAIVTQVRRYHIVQRFAARLWLNLRAVIKEYAVPVDIVKELGTSSIRNAPVLSLFESCQRMFENVKDLALTWMRRSSDDIQRHDVQDYHYGLRMLFAFAKVVQKCFLSYEEEIASRAEEKETMSLGLWNCIAQNRCLCENCKRLQKIKKPHLASLPLWLCAKYADFNSADLHLPRLVTQRADELMAILNVPPKEELYRAPLFCFWPQCEHYEIQRLEIPGNSEVEECDMPERQTKARQHVTQQLFKRSGKDRTDNPYEFIVSIIYPVEKKKKGSDPKDLTPFVVVIMRLSESQASNSSNSPLDLRWMDVSLMSQQKIDCFPIFADMESCLGGSEPLPTTITERSIRARIGIIRSPDAPINSQGTEFMDFELGANIKNPEKKAFSFEVTENAINQLAKSGAKAAVSLSRSQHAWDANQFLHVLKLLKHAMRSKDDVEKIFSTKCDSKSKFKFVKKFSNKSQSADDYENCFTWACDCVQHIRDQSIAYMSDLRETFQDQNKSDKNLYESCQDTICQFINKIKIVDFVSHSAGTEIALVEKGMEGAILQIAVAQGLPGFEFNGETALHYFASRGDFSAVQHILSQCNEASFIIDQASKFRLTLGMDAFHTALVFQHLTIADAILERLEQIWMERKPKNGLHDLKKLLQRKDPVAKTTSLMLLCRFGNEELLARVSNLLKIANQGVNSFPEILQVTLFEKDRSGLTALHHAVRSGNKLVVRWCMQNTALAMPGPYDLEDSQGSVEDTKKDRKKEKGFSPKSLIPDGASQQTKATLWEYRVWRTKYDLVSVGKHKKNEFRSLWNHSKRESQDSQQAPLDLVESEFRSSSGSIYDYMVSRAEHHACDLMYPLVMNVEGPSVSLPDHSDDCDCEHCKVFSFKHHATISPFELALVLMYVHDIDKKQQKSLNVLDQNLDQSKQRFIASLQVVEEMLACDGERNRRESKATHKTIDPQNTETGSGLENEAQKNYRRCHSADNFHYQFYSSSVARSILCCALFGVIVIFCAIWMAAGPSAELVRWQTTVSDAAFQKDDAQLASNYEDLTAFLSALSNFSVPWPPDSSFTRSLGDVILRVIRIDKQSSPSCIGSENLACVPTINVFPYMSPRISMLPSAAYSRTPPTFSAPPYSNNFKYQDSSATIRCGSVYCFDGSGYIFQATGSSEFVAALRSQIFDSDVRAVILSFALYSPSLQAAYKGSYIAEVLPTGNVLGAFDAFVVDYVNSIALERIQLLTALKIIVLFCAFFYFMAEFVEYLLEDNPLATQELNQLAKLKIQLYVTYNKPHSSPFKRSWNVFKAVFALSLPACQSFIFWFILFLLFNFLWPALCVLRNMAAFLAGKKKLYAKGDRFYSKYTASISTELDKFVFFLFKPGQLNIIDSLVMVFVVVSAFLDLAKTELSKTIVQSIYDGSASSSDSDTRLRMVTVTRNYILSLLVISVCCKFVKYLSLMPNEYSLYMRAMLSVFADKTVGIFVAMFLFVITAFGLASEVAFFDRDSKLQSTRSAWMDSFLSLNGMGGTNDYVFTHQALEPDSYGYAGFYFCATTLIGNLILSNLIVNVLGERYSQACEYLVTSKRKLQIKNFVDHGRHILLHELYFRSSNNAENAAATNFLLSLFPRPFFPWLSNKLDSFLDGTVRQKNVGAHYWSIMKILRIPESAIIAHQLKKKRKEEDP